MSVAQLLIGVIGLGASTSVFVLMRFPQHRRQQYRGEPFSLEASVIAAAFVFALCLVLAWAQGQFESHTAVGRLSNDRGRSGICHASSAAAARAVSGGCTLYSRFLIAGHARRDESFRDML